MIVAIRGCQGVRMTGLELWLYEHLTTDGLEDALQTLDSKRIARRARLHPEEAADRLALHLATLVRQAVSSLDVRRRTELGVGLARKVGDLLAAESKGIEGSDLLSDAGELLAGILARLPDGSPETLPTPATPLLDTTLLTNAPGEPRIGFQINSEIGSADRIDVLMA